MILVDSSVWIPFFKGIHSARVDSLERFISEEQDLCTCGVIMAEVLQGIRHDNHYKRIKGFFSDLLFLPMTKATFITSAETYRFLRKKGIPIRKPIDCMIAAVAIEHDIVLLHNDRDFDSIEKHCKLKTVKTEV